MSDIPENKMPDAEQANEKYISALWWISFVLTMILYTAAFIITVRCYIPYSFDGQLTSDMRIFLYTLLSACAVLIVFSMLLSHLLKKKLSDIAMIGIFALGCALVAAPTIFKLVSWRETMYALSAYIFFMLPLSLLFVFYSLAGEKKSRALGYFTSVLSAVIMLIALAATVYVTVAEPVFDFLCAVMLLPIISSVSIILGFGAAFGGIIRSMTLMRQFILLGLTAVISNFGIGEFAHIAFLCVLAVTSIMLVYDIIYYMITNQNEQKERIKK